MNVKRLVTQLILLWVTCILVASFFSGRVNSWCGYAANGEASAFSILLGPAALVYHVARWVEIRSANTCYGHYNGHQ